MNMHSKVVSLFLVALVSSGAALAQGQTARAALKDVQAAAQKWQKDALLTNVTTQGVDAGGAASEWRYLFYSPKSKQAYAVAVKNGKIADQHPVGPHLTDAVGDFVDSDAAMKTAKGNGLKVQHPAPMALMVMGQDTRSKGAYWTIGTGYTPGEVSVLVEARSGKFFRKQEMK